MPRYKTIKGLMVSSCLMLTASAEGQTREEAGPTSRVAVQDKRGDSNPVIHWNRIANEIFPVDVGPVIDSRAMAILHAAIHDAVNGIERRYQPYTVALSSPGASLDAAVASAARDVMLALTHNQQPRIEQEYAAALADVPDGPAKDQGVLLGQQAARANLDRRADDGIVPGPWPPQQGPITEPVYVPTGKPGDYDFTPPFDAPPLGPVCSVSGLGPAHAVRHRPRAPSPQRTRSIAQQALCARPQLPQGVRQASRFVANTRPDQHGLLLVRAIRDLERHRHDGDAAGTGQSVARCARSGAHELRRRRCGDRVLRRQISLPLLAALHGHPPRQRGRQRRDRAPTRSGCRCCGRRRASR